VTLAAGSCLGVYQIIAPLGAGGMGEVYRARDPKLGRDVALKILLPEVSGNPDRLARFQREATTLAALNHPHIAQIYGLEESPSGPYLVLEFVDGLTLDERLSRGRLPVKEALSIARQTAEAVEAAHEHGIVHRDLKPANVKLRPDGTVKVLDFGLAKAMYSTGSVDRPSTEPFATVSEAVTSPPSASPVLTGVGALLGTAAYMSPEQARGEAVDKRADIWAFGCVLFQMLSGTSPFARRTVSETIATILEHDIDLASLPADTPEPVRRLLRRCLTKDQGDRLRDIGDARLDIDEALRSGHTKANVAIGWRHDLPWAIALFSTVVALGFVSYRSEDRPVSNDAAARFPVRVAVTAPARHQLDMASPVGVSRDGRAIAFSANDGGTPRIFVQDLGTSEAVALPGTEGGYAPFFSPDGQWVGFFAAQKMRKVLRSGGAPLPIADFAELAATRSVSASWDEQDTIFFTPDVFKGIWRVSASGGAPTEVTKPASGESFHLWPQLLPGGRSILFTAIDQPSNPQVYVQRLDTGERKAMVRGYGTRYLPSGHLVFVQGGSLMAVPFDPERLELTGSPAPIIPDVTPPFRLRTLTDGFNRLFDVSPSGTLAFMSAGPRPRHALVWVDRAGRETPTGASGGAYAQPRLSPDGRRIAVVISSDDLDDVWMYEIARNTWSRFTLEGNSNFPLWTADGTRLILNSDRSGGIEIVSKRADSASETQTLVPRAFAPRSFPFSSSPDGTLAFVALRPAQDVWVVRPGEVPRPFIATPYVEGAPMFAPDGRSVAYVSRETGRNEIYLQPFPGPGQKVPISSQGGNEPFWSPTGRELFFRAGDAMMAVDVIPGATLKVGQPHLLFEGNYEPAVALYPNYSTVDGQRFVMVKRLEPSAASNQVNVVINWLEDLKHVIAR
jgi:serine/threonine protein kinase/Tol biopolymer transport system component